MTSFGKRVVGRTFGHQPEVRDGVRGEALVLHSVASVEVGRLGGDQLVVGGLRSWACGIPLLVRVPGREPYYLRPVRWMSRAKYPIAGTTLPVTVDRGDPSVVRIEWDEMPEIDEWIASGHPVFTDPDSVQARLREAVEAHAESLARGNAAHAADMLGPAAPVDRDALQQIVTELRARHAESNPAVTLHRQQIDGPSGRILAVGPSGDAAERSSYGEVLLSVAAPGQPRYGARCMTYIPRAKMKAEWWDVPLEIDRRKPGKVKIPWNRVAGIEVVTPVLREATDRLQAALAAERPAATLDSFRPMLAAIADPVKRAEVERQLAQGLQGQPGAAPTAAPQPDPLEQLEQLGKLRDAGALTEAEFAAEKARVLADM